MARARRSRSASPPAPERLPTHVRGLDRVLGGGLLRGGLYLLAGGPGTGKTVLANQIAYGHAAAGGLVVYATLLTESHARLLANLRSLAFFQPKSVGERVVYVSGHASLYGDEGGLERLQGMLEEEVRRREASLLVVDGMRVLLDTAADDRALRRFLNRLKALLELRECTAVFCSPAGPRDDPVHTMADGILCLEEPRVGLRAVRELFVSKFRGSGHLGGVHQFRIDERGVEVFPRTEAALREVVRPAARSRVRRRFGVRQLDAMLGGGIPEGTTTALLGSPGSGKTLLGLSFLAEGARRKERSLYYGVYESPDRVLAQGERIGLPVQRLAAEGALELVWTPPYEVLYDPLVQDLLERIEARRIKRLYLDGLDGLARGGVFPERSLGLLTALTNELRARGVTTLLSVEAPVLGGPIQPPNPASALLENAIALRFVELRSQLYRLISVLKVRGSSHDPRIREFRISDQGIEVADTFESAEAILSGQPRVREPRRP